MRAGRLDTELVDRFIVGREATRPPDDVLAAVAIGALGTPGDDVWSAVDGWRLGGRAAPTTVRVDVGDGPVEVAVRAAGDRWVATVGTGEPFTLVLAGAEVSDAPDVGAHHSRHPAGERRLRVRVAGDVRGYRTAVDGDTTWVGAGGSAWPVRVEHRWRMDRPGLVAATDGLVTSPMPGTVLEVRVAGGDVVSAGQTVAVVEAMKMEHPLLSRIDGIVGEVLAAAGQRVGRGDAVVRVEPSSARSGHDRNVTSASGGDRNVGDAAGERS